ncbi:GIY-YIG nuclease family protein [Acidiphilium sp. JA12-A1]|uniref:GIY-YIG nuclease family protein n=1 Tax=Acidiphilium sp. JA12-A1 TaxID=1464546 RepID=UPI001967D87C|nr:GIY-YIG nuclease family protein [Acidiphilium sp. JA12-A1]
MTSETLLNLGFRDVGMWGPGKGVGSIDYHLDSPNAHTDGLILRERNSLYAFVHKDEVKYIGKTARTIRERFAGYRNPGQRQQTNLRCNRNIQEMLDQGDAVRIFVFNPISFLRYGDFEINLAAGLEDALIEAFDPPWNGREQGRTITEEAEREEEEESEQPVPDDHDLSVGLATAQEAPPPSRNTDFQITLGEAYYSQGFINPGVEASAHLGAEGDLIEVTFDDGTEPVISKIDRRANRNGSVRIVGRNRAIARWFQSRFQRGDVVKAQVLNPHCILLFSGSSSG